MAGTGKAGRWCSTFWWHHGSLVWKWQIRVLVKSEFVLNFSFLSWKQCHDFSPSEFGFITGSYKLTHLHIYQSLLDFFFAQLLFNLNPCQCLSEHMSLSHGWIGCKFRCLISQSSDCVGKWGKSVCVCVKWWWWWWARAWYRGRTGNACADGGVMWTHWEGHTGNSLLCSCVFVFIWLPVISGSSFLLYSEEAKD